MRLIMSNIDRIKSMPYSISDGDIELIKIRSSAAVVAAVAKRQSRRRITRWCLSVTTAMCMLLVVVIGLHRQQTDYELFIEQLDNVSESVLYDMSVDAVEYSDDVFVL